MSFDELIDFRGQHSVKWDMMAPKFGVPADDGLAMWVADMDFRPPAAVIDKVRDVAERGLFTYFGDRGAYDASVSWWMQERHGWTVRPEDILPTNGLVNALSMGIETWSRPGEGVVIFTPVYHVFSRIIRDNGRRVVECPLAVSDGMYQMDFDAWDAQMTGDERIAILCSPHNPGGRVWTRAELQGMADFARRHDLILMADEIHHDLVYPGQKHIVMPLVDPAISDRLVMLAATSKTFNVAGMHCGNVIIQDEALRAAFARRIAQLAIAPNSMSLHMTPALYSPEGAEWVDRLTPYLAENSELFRAGVEAIPGVTMHRMQGTYLSWVDFAATGLPPAEIGARVTQRARIAASPGPDFGPGGDSFMRFNLAMPRVRIREAVTRLQAAFSA